MTRSLEPVRPGRFLVVLLYLLLTLPNALAQAPERIQNGARGFLADPPVLDPAVEVGQEGAEEALLYRPADFFFDPEGDLYVVDSGNKAVMVYDREGGFLRRIGQDGSGPGEFRSPVGGLLDWDGNLVVLDSANQRRSRFTLDGTFLGSEALDTFAALSVPVRADQGRYLRSGNAVLGGGGLTVRRVTTSGGGLSGTSTTTGDAGGLVQLIDTAGEVVQRYGERRGDGMSVADRMRDMIAFVGSPDGKVILAYQYENLIQVFDRESGRLEREITRRLPFEPRDPTSDMQPQEVVGSGGERTMVMRGTITADRVTVDLTVDPDGRMWVLSNRTDSDVRSARLEAGETAGLVALEVFAPDGRLLAVLELDFTPRRLAFDPQGDLWLLDGESSTLRRYEVVWS
jgi:sugar lactone lactonase YvrE